MEMEVSRTSKRDHIVLMEIESLKDLLDLSKAVRPTTMAKLGELIISKSEHDEYWQIEIVDDWR